MPRLTEVQRGQAIALLMQGQRQQQVALQFGVNVSTIERLVRHLRDTGRVPRLSATGASARNDATSRQGYSSCPPA
jgi:transposase